MQQNPHSSQEHSDKSMADEIMDGLEKHFKQFLEWLKPNPEEPWYIAGLRYLYKIPVIAFYIVASPVLLIVLLFAFLVAF